MQTPTKPRSADASDNTLLAFESAVYRRQHRAAIDQLIAILFALASGKFPLPAAREAKTTVYTRLAAAITALFSDPLMRLSPPDIAKLAVVNPFMGDVFLASAYGNPDVALKLVVPNPSAPGAFADSAALVKYRALFSINSAVNVPLPELLGKEPASAMLAYLGLSSTKPVLTPQAQVWRERILQLVNQMPIASLPDGEDFLVMLSSAWMLCSYAEGPRKHAIKVPLNRVLRRWLDDHKLTDAVLPAKRVLSDRPKLMVVAEVFHSNHVQWRYFGQWIRQLAPHFCLSLVAEERHVDEFNRGLFEEVHTFKRSASTRHIADVVTYIKSQAPDMIFYPSVGMANWGIVLANLRLAPIQFSAIGHSASTFCPTMDYYLIEQGYVSDPALLSETVILLDDRSLRFERSPHYRPVIPATREKAPALRIALSSNLRKLNAPFLQICRNIAAASPRPLEFHLFQNTTGLLADAAEAVIRRYLPRCVIHSTLDYNSYLQRLNECDLSFSPYPFGGLHSVVDCLRQGIAVVAMERPEPHGRTDAMLIRRLGLPEWLIAKTPEQYKTVALSLVTDDAKRVALSRQAVALNIDNELFGDATTPLRTEIADAVKWIYRNHERAQKDGRHAWKPEERV